MRLKDVFQLCSRQRRGVGALRTCDSRDLVRVVGQPEAPQLALVPIGKFATVDLQKHPVESVLIVVGPQPLERSRHTEVDQQGRSVGGSQEPLADPLNLDEPSSYKSPDEIIARPASYHARVPHDDGDYQLPDCVSIEEAAISLHVWQLWHGRYIPARGNRPIGTRLRNWHSPSPRCFLCVISQDLERVEH